MSVAAARTPPKRRGGLRVLIVLVVVVLIVGGALYWLNASAQAATNAVATLTVFQPNVSVSRGGGAFLNRTSGTIVQAGDGVKTDTKGRGAIELPDGTLTRLASDTEITLTAAHFSKQGNLHDVSISEKVGRTLTTVQHLVSGATFKVAGQSAVASVRGTKFEVYVKADGTMVVKLFEGQLDFDGKNHVHLVAPQQATADPQGNVGNPGPIQPDPGDPFGPQLAASAAIGPPGTTAGTEQDYVGPPIHNGETQAYTYSFAGGGLVKAALGYPGSAMQLKVTAPDGQTYTGNGASPIVVVVANAPPGIYTVTVIGVSGLGANGEEPFLSVAALEPCTTANIRANGSVREGYTSQDLSGAIQVSGLSNLSLTIVGTSLAGAVITGTGTYNGVGWTGTVVLTMHGGALEIVAVGATVFNVSVPAQQIVQQIGAAIGQDPTNINPGFAVDRLFTCSGVLMIDGRTTP
jgi:ferric-dicitrate binding protein FerR (iron transport regulator)